MRQVMFLTNCLGSSRKNQRVCPKPYTNVHSEMPQGSSVQTPAQVLRAVSRGLGEVGALLLGNPTARMLHIVHQNWPRPAALGTSPVALLWQLAALHKAGVLTPEEFTEKKQRLLARI